MYVPFEEDAQCAGLIFFSEIGRFDKVKELHIQPVCCSANVYGPACPRRASQATRLLPYQRISGANLSRDPYPPATEYYNHDDLGDAVPEKSNVPHCFYFWAHPFKRRAGSSRSGLPKARSRCEGADTFSQHRATQRLPRPGGRAPLTPAGEVFLSRRSRWLILFRRDENLPRDEDRAHCYHCCSHRFVVCTTYGTVQL